MPSTRPGELHLPNLESLGYCVQVQVRYLCGHSTGGEFIKCRRHQYHEDERCTSRLIQYIDGKVASHKCRRCLRSE
ncbi:hypothetical protein N7535_003093 [Penicillium sp. DV-2018c]|nr:hypothetical protein N7461_001214 [Penicillium sp. DV-2018c]KAJ5576167.1 hypothetical protein N7535_003093 [Penicillium sp. DV-2018c]